jgi:type V secretory pathway adhesin AidA
VSATVLAGTVASGAEAVLQQQAGMAVLKLTALPGTLCLERCTDAGAGLRTVQQAAQGGWGTREGSHSITQGATSLSLKEK